MERFAIAFGILLVLVFFWLAMRPGTPGNIMRGPGRKMTPPDMFHQIDSNTVINLP
jgi:hypothetical protein